jgi:hypothetical protein
MSSSKRSPIHALTAEPYSWRIEMDGWHWELRRQWVFGFLDAVWVIGLLELGVFLFWKMFL